MNPGDFVRVSRGGYQVCTGVIVAAVDGGYDVRLTATGLVRWFGEMELRRDKRTSEIAAEAAAREAAMQAALARAQAPRLSIRERLKGVAA